MDFERYIRLLQGIDFAGPLILHGLREEQADIALQFLAIKLQR